VHAYAPLTLRVAVSSVNESGRVVRLPMWRLSGVLSPVCLEMAEPVFG
jgi:hypothetical protein